MISEVVNENIVSTQWVTNLSSAADMGIINIRGK